MYLWHENTLITLTLRINSSCFSLRGISFNLSVIDWRLQKTNWISGNQLFTAWWSLCYPAHLRLFSAEPNAKLRRTRPTRNKILIPTHRISNLLVTSRERFSYLHKRTGLELSEQEAMVGSCHMTIQSQGMMTSVFSLCLPDEDAHEPFSHVEERSGTANSLRQQWDSVIYRSVNTVTTDRHTYTHTTHTQT